MKATAKSRRRARYLRIPTGPYAPLPKLEFLPDTQRLMQCQNEFFTAGAIWCRIQGQWSCIKAAPIIRWMEGMDRQAAKHELLKRGCSWEWVAPTEPCHDTAGFQSG